MRIIHFDNSVVEVPTDPEGVSRDLGLGRRVLQPFHQISGRDRKAPRVRLWPWACSLAPTLWWSKQAETWPDPRISTGRWLPSANRHSDELLVTRLAQFNVWPQSLRGGVKAHKPEIHTVSTKFGAKFIYLHFHIFHFMFPDFHSENEKDQLRIKSRTSHLIFMNLRLVNCNWITKFHSGKWRKILSWKEVTDSDENCVQKFLFLSSIYESGLRFPDIKMVTLNINLKISELWLQELIPRCFLGCCKLRIQNQISEIWNSGSIMTVK